MMSKKEWNYKNSFHNKSKNKNKIKENKMGNNKIKQVNLIY